MLDIAWPELMVIGAVALMVISPKDLPQVMRTLGRMARKAGRATHEVRAVWQQLSYEAETLANKEKVVLPTELSADSSHPLSSTTPSVDDGDANLVHKEKTAL